MRLIGAQSNGPINLTGDLPIEIPAVDFREIRVKLELGRYSNGMVLARGELWADANGLVIVPILIGCRVNSLTGSDGPNHP